MKKERENGRKIIVIDKIRKTRDVQRKIIKMMLRREWRKREKKSTARKWWEIKADGKEERKKERQRNAGINYGKKRKERKIRKRKKNKYDNIRRENVIHVQVKLERKMMEPENKGEQEIKKNIEIKKKKQNRKYTNIKRKHTKNTIEE